MFTNTWVAFMTVFAILGCLAFSRLATGTQEAGDSFMVVSSILFVGAGIIALTTNPTPHHRIATFVMSAVGGIATAIAITLDIRSLRNRQDPDVDLQPKEDR